MSESSETTHSFKVVLIQETNEIEPVPHQWEENGILYWPCSRKDTRKYQSNASSKPNKQEWVRYHCVVKDTNILIYSHATAAADNLCQVIESSSGEDSVHYKHVKSSNRSPYDAFFNDNNKITERQNVESVVLKPLEVTENAADSDFFSVIPETDITKLMSLFQEFKTLCETKFADISAKQNQIETQLAEISSKQDEIEKLITTKITNCTGLDNEDKMDLLPLNSIDEVNNFEIALKDNQYKDKVIVHLTKIIGSGINWKNAAYRLSSVLFTKALLVFYSWTGVSRTDTIKEPFCKLINILDVFFRVVHFADNSFNHMQKEKFFKDCILKHSQSRLHPKKGTKKGEIQRNLNEERNLDEENEEHDGEDNN